MRFEPNAQPTGLVGSKAASSGSLGADRSTAVSHHFGVDVDLVAQRDSTAPEVQPFPLPGVARSWHDHGMARTRLSTTVDRELLDDARKAMAGTTDAKLIDQALTALLARYRTAEIDQAYATAYGAHPIDEPDECGDLASFRDAAAAT